jgi:hypothetical protein
MRVRKKGYGLLLAVTVLLTIAAISTLIPAAGVSKACLLGYKAHCTFTPISTIICVLLAGASCVIRKRMFTENIGS